MTAPEAGPEPVIVPSATASAATGAPSFAAASSSRIWRASAQAKRRAVPLFSTERLPAVMPSLGVRAVSADTISMRS
ncbi:hypothetical protein D3C83_85230 [compost metagenome]